MPSSSGASARSRSTFGRSSEHGGRMRADGRIVVGKLPNPAMHFSGSNREAGVLKGCDGATHSALEV